jgi:hypothetical protein
LGGKAYILLSPSSCSSLDPSSQSWTPEEVYDEVLGVQDYLNTNKTLYNTRDKWSTMVTDWYSTPLLSLDMAAVRKEVNTFMKTVDHLEKSKLQVHD